LIKFNYFNPGCGNQLLKLLKACRALSGSDDHRRLDPSWRCNQERGTRIDCSDKTMRIDLTQ
jgi:hypothetical protein